MRFLEKGLNCSLSCDEKGDNTEAGIQRIQNQQGHLINRTERDAAVPRPWAWSLLPPARVYRPHQWHVRATLPARAWPGQGHVTRWRHFSLFSASLCNFTATSLSTKRAVRPHNSPHGFIPWLFAF